MKLLTVLTLLTTTAFSLPSDDLSKRELSKLAPRATVCGSGYELEDAIPLPEGTDPDMRLGMLFAYGNNGKGCVILDNNTGPNQYMYVKICEVLGDNCDKDSGTFSEYAGPVYVDSFACAEVTAKMGETSGNLYIDYESEYVFPCN